MTLSNRSILRARQIPEVKLSASRLVFASSVFFLGISLLIWNEMKAVEVNKIITSVIEDIHKINDIGSVNKRYDGKLVYLYGFIEVEEPLTEPEYGLSVPAVILKRRVQMYQWVEKKEESTEFPVSSYVYISPNVKIGAFTLSNELKNKFRDFTLITSDERPERHDIKMHAGLYYHTLDVWDPKVGDIRLQFSYAGNTGDAVSIIATQTGRTLGGNHLLLLEKGKISPEEMITKEHNWNMWLIRLYRTCGWVCLYMASSFFKSLFYYIALKYKTIYIFLTMDRRISSCTSVSSVLMAFIICGVWLFYKPWIGVIMLLTFITPFVWCATFREVKDNSNTYKKI
ncbi:transmembrane protein 43 homolog isoform X2 [Halyomorpha halys]|uniref:transmembrane protein 43 homolog isoform X2 n=1 Tax=Halyomorpha halys TaxID=286706 RepID=UPI0034D36405